MLFTKPLAEIDESDLQTLVDNGVREGKEIEYKEALTLFSPEQKQEFLNDVSSFANTNGGLLFYGIRESKDDAGVPLEVCGLKGENPGKRINDMETIIRTGLEPRLLGVTIWPVSLPSHEDQVVLILSIPKSFAAPHMIKSSGRFYSRNSTGKFQLDVTQIRAAFELAGTTAERIRAFRTERLSRISSEVEIPAPLIEEDPKLVLHLIPLNAFSTGETFDLKPLNHAVHGKLADPLSVYDGEPTVRMRFNIDGFVRSTRTAYNATTDFGYTQVFRSGIVETVDTSLLMINAWNRKQINGSADPESFSGERYERKLVVAVKRYLELQKFLGSNPPFFVMVSFLGVKGYKIALQRSIHHIAEYTSEIDRNNLIIPEVMIDDFDVNVAGSLRPIFDAVWNAAGSDSSPNYDETGKFRFND